MTETKTKQTAAGCYAERYAETQDLLKRIASRLAEHQKQQPTDPTNWRHADNLGHITEQLAYVLAEFGDRSAVDAKGLDY